MQQKYLFIRVSLFLSLVLSGCDLINPEEPVPGYLKIDKISLNDGNSSGITDAWVYVDNNLVGVFELPAQFPVIASGTSEVTIRPGIKVNGISATRTYYPFYTAYSKQVDFEPSKVIVLKNVPSGDVDWVEIPWKENFENGGDKFEINDKSDTTLIITSAEKFSGQYSGAAFLDTAHSYFQMETVDLLTRPDFSNPVGMYLEMNFKCDTYIIVGIFIYASSGVVPNDIIYLNPTDVWKKIYIDLYNPLVGYTTGTPFRIFIASVLGDNKEKASIYLDDMRVVQ